MRALTIGLMSVALTAGTALAGPPSWDTVIDGKSRFKVLPRFGNEAVLDKETGLVWQRDPSVNNFNSWSGAVASCRTKNTGGRGGWRLPTIEELRSLADPARLDPALPPDHPFQNVAAETDDLYWAATRRDDTLSYTVRFFSGEPILQNQAMTERVWCVRGSHGTEGL